MTFTSLVRSAAVAAVFVSFAAFAAVAPEDKPNEARIAEIAAALPEKAGMVGFRPEDRARWAEIAKTKKVDGIVKSAERMMEEPIPATPDDLYLECTRNGNRTNFQKPYFAKISNLEWMTFAEALEQKGRFIPKIVEYVENLMAERSWVMPAHDLKLRAFDGKLCFIDLGCAHRMTGMAACYALLKDRLPEGLPARMVAELRRRGLDNYLEMAADPGKRGRLSMGWFFGRANWNAVCNSCVVRTALNVFDDRMTRARFVEATERTTRYFLSGFTPDGYCSEGTGYWSYGYGHHLYMGLAVRAATGGKVDLFKDPINRQTMLYAYGAKMSANQGLPFADGTSAVGPAFYALARQVWPDLVCTAALKNDYVHADFDQFPLRAFGQEPPPAKPTMDEPQARNFFPDAQVFVMRAPAEGKDKPEFNFAVKGGHNNEQHNHNDVGSIAISYAGEQFVGDPRGEVYTRFTFSPRRYESKMLNSYGHPVPVVAGKLQTVGAEAAAKVLSAETSDAQDKVVIDLTAAYPEAKTLKSLVRTVVFDRAARTATVTDKVAFAEPSAFETPIVTYGDVISDYVPTHFTLQGNRKNKIDVNVSATGGDWEWKTDVIPNPTRESPKRFACAFKQPVSEAEVSVVYKAL